ncbi:MAG: tryptophan synthase subunit alpha [Bacteroidetes bacterium]|nr:tryptophan synthase subunit alpha [Bacteroidota bacterium]
MNRIKDLFKVKDKAILNVFVTAGYPNLSDMPEIVKTLAASGVDMVEIGMPYSDPLADGETIQHSSKVALENGMHLDLLFEQLRALRPTVDIPIILMGYFNQLMQYGVEAFIQAASEAGVDGMILPDLPLIEYERTYKPLFEAANISVSFLICPSTPADRIRKIDTLSQGFIYMVADAATTGQTRDLSEAQRTYFKHIQRLDLQNPRLIGFGISTRDHFVQAAQFARGAIIGSAFLRAIDPKKPENESNSLDERIRGFVGSILEPTVSVG